MKNKVRKITTLICAFILFTITTKAAINFYPIAGATDLSVLTQWCNNPAGTPGGAPGAFTSGTFNIVNSPSTGNSNLTIGANWVVTGATVIVGDGTNSVNFTIPSTLKVTGTLNSMLANATLTIKNTATLPTFVMTATAFNVASTVDFFGMGNATTIPLPATPGYGNVIFDNTTFGNSGTTTFIFSGNFTLQNGGGFNPGGVGGTKGTINLAGSANQTITGGTSLIFQCYNFSDTTKTGGTVTLAANTPITLNNTLWLKQKTGSSTMFSDGGNTITSLNNLNLGGVAADYSFTGTIILSGTSGTQKVEDNQTTAGAVVPTLNNITISTTGTGKVSFITNTVASTITIGGAFNITTTGGAITLGTTAPTTGTDVFNVNGNYTNSTTTALTFNPSLTASYVLNGSSAQTLQTAVAGGETFPNLTISNLAGATLLSNFGVTGNLNLSSGNITLGANTLKLAPGATITGGSSSSYVVTNAAGTLTEGYLAAGTYTFPVGDNIANTDYAPISLVFSAGTLNGTISVLTGGTKYTNNKSNTNFLDRYWTITQSGLTPYTCTSLTGTYLSGTPADINGTIGNIDNAFWNGSTWTTYGAVTTTPYNVVISSASINPFGTISGIDNSVPSITGFSQSCTTLTVNTTGGQTPLTYSWNPGGATTATITASVSNYTCTVTDANEFTTSAAVSFTALAPNPTFTNIACGSPTGTAQVAPTGGVPPYTYSWAPGGQTTASIAGLSAGTYTSTVQDNGGCTKTSVITISSTPMGLSITSSTNQVDCTPGSATATATNGVTPYTYTWSSGFTSISAGASTANLSGGTYTVTAQDNSGGCSATTTITILTSQMRDSILTSTSGSQVIDYWDFNNQLPVSTAITSIAAQYSLVTGASVQYNPNAINPTPTGGVLESALSGTGVNDLSYLYAVNTVLGNDSSSSASGNLYLKALNPAANAQMTLILPTSGYNNIILNYAVEVSSSTSAPQFNNVSYSTDGGATWKTPTSAMQTAGSFTAPGVLNLWTALSWKPVQFNFSSDPSVSNNPNFEVKWTFSVPNTGGSGNDRYDNISLSGTQIDIDGCNGANVFAATKYGVGPFAYSWSDGSSTVSTSNPTGPILTAGTYTVTVTDGNSCSSSATTTIGSAPSPISASISSSTNATCNVDGSATASVTGGITPYAYSWSNGTSTVSTSNPTGNILIAGSYTLTATDINGCKATTSVMVTQPAVVTVSITSSTNIECNTFGSATALTAGGTPPFSYLWSDGETTSAATGLSLGTYTITATDINGCSGSASGTILKINQIRDSIVASNTVIDYWDFNNQTPTSTAITNIPAQYSLVSGATIAYNPNALNPTPVGGILESATTGTGVNNLNYMQAIKTALGNDSASGNLYLKALNPAANSQMYLYLPTTGYNDIVLNYAVEVSSSTSAPQYNNITYSTDGGTTWKTPTSAMQTIGNFTSPGILNMWSALSWAPVQIDFSSDSTVNNNPNFEVTWTFSAPNTGGSGNDRYDNVSIWGNPEETCNGGNSVTLVNGIKYGVAPYTYTWSPNVSTTATASNLSAGSYSVTVSDANGCSASSSYTIAQPALLAASIASSANVSCNGGSDGNAIASVTGGSLPYTYNWTPGGVTTATALSLSSDTYTVTIQDNCGATATASVFISQPAILAANATVVTNLLCFGDNNGSAQSAPSGGTSPYTYAWSSGETTSAIFGKNATTYTLTVQDNNGCSATGSVTITQPSSSVSVSISSETDALCFGSNGSATASASGGTGTINYTWNDANTTTGATLSAIAGNYTVTATDANGCTATVAVTIGQPSSSVSVSILSEADALCFGTNGSATASASGGTGTINYSWNDANTTTGATLSAIAGNYTVTATDANGCTATAAVTIGQPSSSVSVSISSETDALCFGSNGTATANANGGTGTINYTWNDANTTTGAALSAIAGNYTVTATDANGCTATAAVTIGQPSSSGSVSISSETDALCFGTNGSATANANGGTGTINYSWNDANTTAGATLSAIAGNYTVTATDANGCTATAAVTIGQPSSSVSVSISSETDALCFGTNGSATASASGGTGTITYTWNDANSTVGATVSAIAGNYIVTATDANGCSATSGVTIGQPSSSILANAIVTANVNCYANNNGSASSSPSGGTSPYTYLWSDASTTTTSNVSNLSGGSYTVIVTDNHGCSATASIVITAPASPVNVTISSETNVPCNGGNGSATASANGGTGTITYLWNDANSTIGATLFAGAGSYTVTATDINGCSATASITITQPTQFQYVSAGAVSNVSCYNGFNGSVTVNPVGGNPPYTYVWNNASTTVSSNQTATGLSAGTYTITVQDNCGITKTATATIAQPAPLRDSISSVVNILCNGGNGGSASAGVKGGTFPYLYTWSPGGSTLSTVSNLIAGSYTVTVTDQNGCSTTNANRVATITQPAAVRDSVVSISSPLCYGQKGGGITVGVKGGLSPYLYSWAPAVSTTSTVTNIPAGTYTITIKDAHRCATQLVVTLTQPGAIRDSMVAAAKLNVSCNGANNGSATVGVKYGTSPYTYHWTPNVSSTATASNLSAGMYSVTVTDKNGCLSATASVSITQPLILRDSVALLVGVGCYGGSGGQISIGTRGGTQPYTYAWSNGKTAYTMSGLSAGIYTVTVTDHGGCSNTLSATVTQPAQLLSAITDSCLGFAQAKLTAIPTGGVAPYTYKWSNGKTTSSLNVPNGTYTITVKDAHGCSETNTVTSNCPNTPSAPPSDGPQQNPPTCCQTLKDVNLYPNPNTGQFTITGLDQGMTIEVFDYTGRRITTLTASDITMHLNIADQPNGIYLVRISDKDGSIIAQKKVIKTQ